MHLSSPFPIIYSLLLPSIDRSESKVARLREALDFREGLEEWELLSNCDVVQRTKNKGIPSLHTAAKELK